MQEEMQVNKNEWIEEFLRAVEDAKLATYDMGILGERAWEVYWREPPTEVAARFLRLVKGASE